MTKEATTQPKESAGAALQLALGKNTQVKAKVEVVAAELGSSSSQYKSKIALGVTVIPVEAALAKNSQVQVKAQECADDLHHVNEMLVQGVDDLRTSKLQLARSQRALADVQAALASAYAAETRARHKALHDELTGLPTRELFKDRLVQAIAMAERHGWTLAVLFLDLDQFKAVNDTYGHVAGDAVLQEVASRLTVRCREEDTVSRFGGDEFLFLLMHPQGRDNILSIAEAMLQSLQQPIPFGTHLLTAGASIGISVYPHDGASCDQLIQRADKAMYQSKRQQQGVSFFSAAAD